MTNLFRKAAEWVDSRAKAHGRTTVKYTRNGASREILAGLGEVRGESGEFNQAQFSSREQDFIFTTQDLKDIGFWPPQLDDRITVPKTADSITGQSGVFVAAALAGQEIWRPSDEHGIATRVHTTRVSD